MAGFALGNLISGAGDLGAQMGEAERGRRFQHQENELNRWQTQHANLAQAIERASGQYAGQEGERLRDLQMEVNSLRPGADLTPYFQKYSQHRQKAAQEVAQAAQMGAAGATQPANPGIAPPGAQAQAPAPLAGLIAGGASQPATSPVQPQVQGGGSSLPAAFPGPTAPSPQSAVGAAPTAPVQPSGASPNVGADAQLPTLKESDYPDVYPPGSLADPSTGIVYGPDGTILARTPTEFADTTLPTTGVLDMPQLLDLQEMMRPSMQAFNNTGYIDPLLEKTFPAELQRRMGLESIIPTADLGVEAGKRKLQAMDEAGVLSSLPDMLQNMIRAETMMGGTGGGALALGPLLGAIAPQSIPGEETVGSLEARNPGFLASQGHDVSKLDPSQPVRVQRSKLPPYGPISAEVESYPSRPLATTQGFMNFDPRTGVSTPMNLTPPAMAPTTSVQHTPGLPDIVTTRTKGGKSAGPSLSGPQKPQTTTNKSIDELTDRVISGATPMPTDNRTSGAVRENASKRGLMIPAAYPAAVQDAISKNMSSLDQINQVLKILEPMKNSTAPFTSTMDALAYKLGIDTGSAAEAIGKISVGDILSAGRVLGGAGIRSNRMNYMEALQHTPSPWKDSGKLMYEKLTWMKQLIEDQNKNALEFQKKSGVIPSPSALPNLANPPKTAEDYLRSVGH